MMPFDTLAGVLVVALGCWAVTAPATHGAVVAYMALGLVVALGWVRLATFDVALTEAAIGAGASGMLLLLAAGRLAGGPHPPPPSAPLRFGAALLSGLVTCGLAALVLLPATPAPSLAADAAAPLAGLGIANPVTAVLLAYRPLDTLLEGVVLVLGLLGVWSLTQDAAWGGAPRLACPPRALPVARLMAQLLPPAGVVVAAYLFWAGTSVPGGKFQAGVVLVAMWLLAAMAGLARAPRTDSPALRLAVVVGPAVFILVGLFGWADPGVFLGYPSGWAKPLILLIEAAMTATIAATLAMAIAGPPRP